MQFNTMLSRQIHKQKLKVRTHGQVTGMLVGYFDWLCGRVDTPLKGEHYTDDTKVFG